MKRRFAKNPNRTVSLFLLAAIGMVCTRLAATPIHFLENAPVPESGASGAEITTGSLPPLSGWLESDTVVHCKGPSDTLRFHFSGPGPTTFFYAINGILQAPVTTTDSLYLLPVTVMTPDTTLFTLDSIAGVDPGMVSGSFAVIIPIPKVVHKKLNCAQVQGPSGTYRVEFDVTGATLPLTLVSGFGTFTGAHFVSTNIPAAQGYTFVFHDASNCDSITVSGLNTCFCDTYAGTMVKVDSLTGCLGTPVTVPHNGDQVLDADDVFMFVLHTEPGLTLGTIIDTNYTEATFEFNFATMGIHVNYWISAIAGNNNGSGGVDPNDPCFSMTPGVPVHWHLLPTIAMDTLIDICPGEPVKIPVELRGSIPRIFTYTKNGQPDTIITTQDLIYLTDTIFNSTLFLPVSVHDLDCPNYSSDTAEVRVHQAPLIQNVVTRCNPASTAYILEFDVNNADLSSLVFDGSVQGTYDTLTGHFSSLPVPISAPYTVWVRDTFQCGVDSISGTAMCNCANFAGTMAPDTLSACVGEIVSAQYMGDAVLAPGDSLVFVLHTSPGILPGTVLAMADSSAFAFDAAQMAPDTLYYISAVAADSAATGIDWSDPCLSLSPGAPVRWHALPEAMLDTLLNSCPGETVSLAVQCSGTAPFVFSYALDGQTLTDTSTLSPLVLEASLQQSAVFQALAIADANCKNNATGQAEVTVHPQPAVSNLEISCNPDNLSYTVAFDVLNADLPTVGISGTVSGTYDSLSGHFLSTAIPVQDTFYFTVSDAWDCGQAILSGGNTCTCITLAGNLDPAPLSLCAGDVASIAPVWGGNLDPNDTLLYFLTTAPAPPGWTIIASNVSPSFPFDPGNMTLGASYYIVAAAGNKQASGVNPDDPCFSYSTGPVVVWKPAPEASLSGDAQICPGDTAVLTLQFSGNGPYQVAYTANGAQQNPVSAATNTLLLPVSPLETTAYILTGVSGDACPGLVSGSADVVVSPVPEIVQDTVICSPADQTYVLEFHISNGAAPNPVYSVQGLLGTLNDSVFVSEPIPSGSPFNALVLTPDGCQAGISGSASCQCQTNAGTLSLAGAMDICIPEKAVVSPNNDATLGAGDTLVYLLYTDSANPVASATSWNAVPEFAFQPGIQAGQICFIAAVAGKRLMNGNIDLTDPCLSVSPGIPVVFHHPPTAVLAGDTSVCQGGNASLLVQFDGTAPFLFQYARNGNPQTMVSVPQNSFPISTSNIQQTQVFTLVSVRDAYCAGSGSGSATVQVIPPPSASLSGDTTVCSGAIAVLTLHLSGGTAFDVVILGTAQPTQLSGVPDGTPISVSPPATTTYSIATLTTAGNACPPVIGKSAVVTVSPPLTVHADVTDYHGFQISCPGVSDGAIVLTPSGGTPPLSPEWNNGAVGFALQQMPEGQYAVTLTDAIGCTAERAFLLEAPPELLLASSTIPPGCTGIPDGAIRIDQLEGGVGPYRYSLDGAPDQPVGTLPALIGNLDSGVYTLRITDSNGCETQQTADVPAPTPLEIFLGPDTTLNFGDSILLEALINGVIDTFAWTPVTGLATPYALQTMAAPGQTTRYRLWVRNSQGCTASDEILIEVTRDLRVYLPTALKPGAVNGNGAFTVFGGPEVQSIRFLRIYDRWGSCLFDKMDFKPNDPAEGWPGTYSGKPVAPGVYLYVTELEYLDGTREVLTGSVTVVQ